MKKYLISVGIISIVLITAFIGYYFLYSLPGYNAQKLKIEEDKQLFEEEKQFQIIKDKETEAAINNLKESVRSSQLDDCLEDAETNYSSNWAKACQSVIDKQTEDFLMCKKKWPDSNCELSNPINKYKEDCSLPTHNADNINDYKETAKNDCYKRFGN